MWMKQLTKMRTGYSMREGKNKKATLYLSTFISGLQQPVKELLRKNLADIRFVLLLDGLVLYRTKARISKLQKLEFLNNTFLVLQYLRKTSSSKTAIQDILRQIVGVRWEISDDGVFLLRQKSFRVVLSDENKLVRGDNQLLRQLEKRISRRWRMRVDRSKPQVEFWLLRRREGVGFFMIRLTRNNLKRRIFKGELRPELAYVLCYLSEPQRNDIFLDPLAGYGAIPLARAKNFPYAFIWAMDRDRKCGRIIKRKIKKARVIKRVGVLVQDALRMKQIADESITRIVTDPPWGLYTPVKNISQFYRKMLREFMRVLQSGGIIVLLTARKEEFEAALADYDNLSIVKKYDILVSGKKAAIYKLVKAPNA